MSPPTGQHVYKPRRSSSPPAKVFVMNPPLSDDARPLLGAVGGAGFKGLSEPYAGDSLRERAEDRREKRRTISPRKRSRHSLLGGGGRAGQQRPCLDFEKMQQVRQISPYFFFVPGSGFL